MSGKLANVKKELQKSWDLYCEAKALHSIIKKFDKLKDDERETFYMDNSESIERFYELVSVI